MIYLKYIFYLGIVYVVFSLIWFFIAKIPKFILSANREEKAWEFYALKTVQYYFIASLTLLKASEYVATVENPGSSAVYFYVVGGITLYLYLYGKLERTKQFSGMKSTIAMMRGKKISTVNVAKQNKFTPHLIGITVIFYLVSLQYPQLVTNSVNHWFLSSINDFYNTIIIGFILGIIGFFFMISMVLKGLSATGELFQQLVGLITGKPYVKKKPKNPFNKFGGQDGANPFGNMGGFGGDANPFGNMSNMFNQQQEEEVNVSDDDDEFVDFEYVDEDEDEHK